MKHLALIPARGGSTGVKDKNLRIVGGESLVAKSWNQCRSARFFDQIILSTDSERIAMEISSKDIFQNAKFDDIYKIGPHLYIHKRSKEDSHSLSLISDLIFKLNPLLDFDFIWLIQPTSPFRNQAEFNEIKLVAEANPNWTSIVSLKDASMYHPDRMFRISGEFVEPLFMSKINDNTPRQLLPKVFIKDGAFYIFAKSNLSKNIFLGNKVIPFFRETKFNINIDTEEDLLIAQFLHDTYGE